MRTIEFGDEVASPGGKHARGTASRVQVSPDGTKSIVKTRAFRFSLPSDDETDEDKQKRKHYKAPGCQVAQRRQAS